jgi:outer membrane usher protein FimD/PapC
MFDQFRFTGASLVSDDSMLPPNLRGYAPEVRGIARTNAKVIVSQQGRVIYQTQVAAGPFRIQDLNQATSGKLDVKVQEQDGSVQTYQVNTANVPYLTRPGSVRYKLALGKPSDMETHHTQGPNFATGEFSWGVSNGWSLFGGGLAAGDYNAASLGVGRDLLAFGAVSLTATESDARLSDEGSLHGGSYQLSYSKNFDQTDSNITFAGYRFSQRNYMNMSTYLAHRRGQDHALGSDKEMYTVTFDQGIPRVFANVYLSYSHQTYWNHPESDSYSIALSRSFDLGSFHDINIEGSVSHNNEYGKNEDIGYVSLTVPWGENRSLSYNANISRHNTTQTVGYSQQIDDRTGIQVNAGTSRNGGTFSGNVDYRGDMAEVNGNANYEEGVYSSVGGSVEGGMTLTANGGALHRQSEQGGTRLMVDTDGVADVPVRGFGTDTHSNHFGKAVIDDISNYSRSEASVDIDHLGNNVEATQSTTEATLTEGAIGYRHFNVIGGQKSMAVIRLADGSTPPFGATVSNLRKQDTGIVSDAGSVYLSGIQPDEKMKVQWGSKTQCTVTLPHTLPAEAMSTTLLLPCS